VSRDDVGILLADLSHHHVMEGQRVWSNCLDDSKVYSLSKWGGGMFCMITQARYATTVSWRRMIQIAPLCPSLQGF
jgi:hypothetical protein